MSKRAAAESVGAVALPGVMAGCAGGGVPGSGRGWRVPGGVDLEQVGDGVLEGPFAGPRFTSPQLGQDPSPVGLHKLGGGNTLAGPRTGRGPAPALRSFPSSCRACAANNAATTRPAPSSALAPAWSRGITAFETRGLPRLPGCMHKKAAVSPAGAGPPEPLKRRNHPGQGEDFARLPRQPVDRASG